MAYAGCTLIVISQIMFYVLLPNPHDVTEELEPKFGQLKIQLSKDEAQSQGLDQIQILITLHLVLLDPLGEPQMHLQTNPPHAPNVTASLNQDLVLRFDTP